VHYILFLYTTAFLILTALATAAPPGLLRDIVNVAGVAKL
jgi:hypothetical protein